MSYFIEGQHCSQGTLFRERLDDTVEEDSPVRVIDGFTDDLDISGSGFRAELAATGRPSNQNMRKFVDREKPVSSIGHAGRICFSNCNCPRLLHLDRKKHD